VGVDLRHGNVEVIGGTSNCYEKGCVMETARGGRFSERRRKGGGTRREQEKKERRKIRSFKNNN